MTEVKLKFTGDTLYKGDIGIGSAPWVSYQTTVDDRHWSCYSYAVREGDSARKLELPS